MTTEGGPAAADETGTAVPVGHAESTEADSTRTKSGSDGAVASREAINPAAVSALLADATRWSITQVTRTGSTNGDLAASGGPHGRVLVAEEQMSGRGRSGRDWSCPEGAGLMFSVLLRVPQIPVDRRGWFGAVLGMAIVRAIAGRTDLQPTLKWPNDLLISGRKCAGILGEVADDALVVGAGINVSLEGSELPREDATSLLLAGAGPDGLNRAALLAGILDEFGGLLDRWIRARGDIDTSGLRAEYLSVCSTVGSRVRLALPGGRHHVAVAIDVAADGSLVVADQDGRRSYTAADVVHLRPDR